MTQNYKILFDLFMELETIGVELSIENSKLIAMPGSYLSGDLIERIKQHREHLIDIVQRSKDLQRCSCGGPLNAIPTFDHYENFECGRCGQCLGCRKRVA